MMEGNKVLRYSILLCRGLLVLIYVFMGVTVTGAIYWHFDPAFFSQVEVTEGFRPGYGLGGFHVYLSGNQPPESAILLSETSYVMMYWLLIRGVFFYVLTIVIIKKIIRILESIRSLKTFYMDNIRHFRTLARYAFLGFIVSSVNFSYFDDELSILIGTAFGPLLVAAACMVLAEIFEEGRNLMEDKNLIV